MTRFKIYWLSVPALNTAQQLLLKESAAATAHAGNEGWLTQLLSSPWFAAAIAAEILCFVIWMKVLSELDLAKAFPLSAVSYVFILASAWFFYREPVSGVEILGSILILSGVWCISVPESKVQDP